MLLLKRYALQVTATAQVHSLSNAPEVSLRCFQSEHKSLNTAIDCCWLGTALAAALQ